MINSEILHQAIDAYGHESQMNKTIEELSECSIELLVIIKTLCKIRNLEEIELEPLSEEIADAEIMLKQIKMIFDIEEDVQRFKAKKLARLQAKITT